MSEDVADTLPAETVADGPRRTNQLETGSLVRGAEIGRYLLLDELGAGGMGVVWIAYDPELHRRVALKLMQPRTGSSSGGHSRTLREAQALAQLSHPNVVAIYDVGTHAGGVFIAMELVEGETLADWMRDGKRNWKECIGVFAAAGRGLAAAHVAGLVHRDFKPSNVLVGKDGRVRVLDFGIARAARESDESDLENRPSRDALHEQLTHTGAVIGTPLYMPPEALRGEVVGPAGDQFSFCMALYEALYGELPFGERAAGEELPALRSTPSDRDVPGWLHRAVVRGLDLRPEYRYPSMDALLAAITDDPAVRRRRLLAFAAGAIGVAALVFAGVAWRAHVRAEQLLDDPCALAAPTGGVWDDAARERLREVFRTRSNADSDAAFARAAAALDDKSRALVAARALTCARTRVDHDQSESVLLVRLACLDDQRDDLTAIIRMFDQASAKALDEAAYAVRRVPSPVTCTEARSLPARDVPPFPLMPAVALLRQRLSHAWALERVSSKTDAVNELRPLLRDARALGYQPVVASVALELCTTLNMAGATREALDACDDAVATTIAAHMDTDAARAAAIRADAGAVAGVQTDIEERWITEAAAWNTRVGDPVSEYEVWEARALSTSSVDAAIVDHRHALALADRLYGETSDLALGTQSMLAYALTLASRLDEAIAIQERTIQGIEHSFGPRGDVYALLLDNYGYNLVHVGRSAEARTNLERAIATPEASKFARAATRCDLARVDLAEGHIDAAVLDGERGIAEIRALGVQKLNLAANEDPLAAAYLAAKRYEDARALAHGCIDELSGGSGDDRVEMVPCLAIEGRALIELGKPADGAARLERALHVLDGQPAAPGVRASAQFALARALVASGGDRARARELAATARAELGRYSFLQGTLAELDAWRTVLR